MSGCTDTQNTGNSLNNFIGTWAGSVGVSAFGGPMGNDSTFTELTFMQGVVVATITNEQGSNTMNYSYHVNDNNLVLEPSFFDEGMMPGRQQNGTQPPFNGTGFPDNTGPFNGTKPPFNNSEPFNDTQPHNYERPPDSQQPPSMSLSFLYSLVKTILFCISMVINL